MRAQSLDRDAQLPNKKMKTMFLSNMSKSQRLPSTFFPTIFNIILIFLMDVFNILLEDSKRLELQRPDWTQFQDFFMKNIF